MGKHRQAHANGLSRENQLILSPEVSVDPRTFDNFSATETDIGNDQHLSDQFAAQGRPKKNETALKPAVALAPSKAPPAKSIDLKASSASTTSTASSSHSSHSSQQENKKDNAKENHKGQPVKANATDKKHHAEKKEKQQPHDQEKEKTRARGTHKPIQTSYGYAAPDEVASKHQSTTPRSAKAQDSPVGKKGGPNYAQGNIFDLLQVDE